MESSIQTLVKVFLKSTKGKESLGKSQFQGLVKNQLSNILSDTESKEAVNNMGQGLDANHDGKVGFEEYLKLVGYLAVSLSEQRTLATQEPAQNAASGQVAQSAADKEEVKPEANAEAKEEAKPEANEEPKAVAAPEVKVEACSGGKIEVVTVKSGVAEGETEPEAAKEEEKPAEAPAEAAAAAVAAAPAEAAAAVEEAAAAAAVEVVPKEEETKEETEKVEEAAEKVAAAEEEVEKKTEEATS